MSLNEITPVTAADRSPDLPLVVDLDGAVLRSGSLQHTVFGAFRHGPAYLWRNPGFLLSGVEALKNTLIKQAVLDSETWPVRADVIDYLEAEARRHRRIILVTQANRIVAEAIVSRFPFIDSVIVVDSAEDAGATKADLLAERFPEGFLYAGDPARDADVWAIADGKIMVSSNPASQASAGEAITTFPVQPVAIRALRKCLRLHQWAKNSLVFLPALLDGKAGDASAWLYATLGFLALSFVASATYVVNDLWDLSDDRRHWSKSKRPLASGEVPLAHAVAVAGALLAIGFLLALAVNWQSTLLLVAYAVGTLSYSLGLKRIPLLDVLVLASLFTVRLGMGMALTDAKLSYWLLVFSMFVFASLSAAKRHTEVRRQIEKGKTTSRRGYVAADLPLLLGFGLASMFAALLISVLYLIEDAFPSGFYSEPKYLWLVPVLLSLFLGRIWLLSQRGELNDDPVEFAVTDRVSLILGALMSASLVVALFA